MTNKLNFTKKVLEALEPTPGKLVYVYNTKVSGLALRVSPSGVNTFVAYRKVNGQPERITPGRFPDLTIEQARGRAAEVNAKIAQGENFNDIYNQRIVSMVVVMTSKTKSDETRERRIEMKIIVDAYNEDERAMGWYYYLEDKLNCPFMARCVDKRAISPLKVGEEVEVIGMAHEDECLHEMFVTVRWQNNDLAVPLAQLELVQSDKKTREAVEDWHYWVKSGYRF